MKRPVMEVTWGRMCVCAVHCPENTYHEKACCDAVWCPCWCHAKADMEEEINHLRGRDRLLSDQEQLNLQQNACMASGCHGCEICNPDDGAEPAGKKVR